MIIVNFPEDERVITTEPVYQWDYGRQLKITGLDENLITEVHFCNRNCIEAKVRLGVFADDGVVVTIPDDLLSDPYNINVFVYVCSGASGKTSRQLQIPMLARKKPESFVETATPTEEAILTEAMDNVQAEIDKLSALYEDAWTYEQLVALIESKFNTPMKQGTMSLTANGWSGTAVPNPNNAVYIGNVYLNTKLSKEEVDSILNKLTWDGSQYTVFETLSKALYILKGEASDGTPYFTIQLYFYDEFVNHELLFDGGEWNVGIPGYLEIYDELTSSIGFGLENDLISSLISITPFEASYNATLSDDEILTEGKFIEIYSTDYEISNGLKSKNITIENGKVNIDFILSNKFDLTEVPVIYRIGNNADEPSWCYFYF